jgi:hypothetical protein
MRTDGIYPLQGLQKTLDSLTVDGKKDAFYRHLAHYNSLVRSEAEADTIAKLSATKKMECDVLYVMMYIGEEIGINQSTVLDLVKQKN